MKYYAYSKLSKKLKQDLEEKFAVQSMDIEDVFTDTQLSKIESHNDYLYIALQFPQFDKEFRKYKIKEIHFFVSHEYFIVVDKNDYRYLSQFQYENKKLINSSINPFYLFYEMLDFFITKKFTSVSRFQKEIGAIEKKVFEFEKNKDLLKEILILRRNLVYFTSIIYPLKTLLEELQAKHGKFIDQIGVEKIDDSLDKIKKLLNNLKNYKEITKLLFETNENFVTRNTNSTVRLLTVFSAIAIPPTFITSFFGMNVWFGWPNEGSFLPLFVISIFVTLITSLLFFIFHKNNWI